MPINSYYLPSLPILCFDFSGDIVPDDVNVFGSTGLQYADIARVYALVDFSNVESMPRNLVNTVLRSNMLIAFIDHPNTQYFVFVQPDPATRLMVDTVFRNTPHESAATRDEGIQRLKGLMP